MLYEIFDHMHLCTDEAVREMLPLVSEQRRQQALRYSHTFGRFCCLKSYLMLLELLSAVYPELDTSKPEFGYTAQGKPFLLAGPDIHFSISHSKNAILVAISDAPIGVDIEAFRSPSAALIARTMNATEQAAIATAATAATPSGLLEPSGTREAQMEQASAAGTREAHLEQPQAIWNALSALGTAEGYMERAKRYWNNENNYRRPRISRTDSAIHGIAPPDARNRRKLHERTNSRHSHLCEWSIRLFPGRYGRLSERAQNAFLRRFARSDSLT